MKLIFYDEAARLLAVTQDVLRHAAARGDLTTAGTQGNRQRLIQEQVMLFTGINPRSGKKKRISYNGLSVQEQALWQRYAAELNTSAVPGDLDAYINTVVAEAVQAAQSELAAPVHDFAEAVRVFADRVSLPKQRAIA